ncbi:MAG TPA: hypothetical protein VIW47_08410, partial [Nitrospiraceae bacterium]
MRNSISAKIGIGVVMMVVVSFLSPWFGNSTLAQSPDKSQTAIEKTFPNSSKCKRCHERVFEEW